MPRCLRIIKVVPRDAGNRMKKIKLFSRVRLRRRTVINAMISQESTPYVGKTWINSDTRRSVPTRQRILSVISFFPVLSQFSLIKMSLIMILHSGGRRA